jgi:proteasome lid subunit RPN8/RPN11
MLDVNELSYAAIITVDLPDMAQPATISVTLAPPDLVETAPGQYKPLRDCSLSDLRAFGEAMEEELWARHQELRLADLAGDKPTQLKITVLDESGDDLKLDKEEVLRHAIAAGDETAEEGEELPSTEESADEVIDDTQAEQENGGQAPAATGPQTELADDVAKKAPRKAEAAEETEVDPGEGNESEDVAIAPAEAPEAAEALRIAGLRRPPGHPTSAAVDILINEPAFREAQAHALSRLDREVAGVLVGPQPEKQPDGRYVVHVTDVIVARHTHMQGASVTYTPESWRYVTDRLLERYPEEEAIIVGWYHTHPGFGIFLSGMDRFIHHHFFTQKWHVALVLDPMARRSGFFCWDREQTEVQTYEFPWPPWAQDTW